ncbi:hypothetical protein Franean1_2609 [Parafrankia sp. EAN1pec]|nr:hypothetical protein Franean1_2609 [Frankia sp. EAN1pec]
MRWPSGERPVASTGRGPLDRADFVDSRRSRPPPTDPQLRDRNQHAPHTLDDVADDEWRSTYSRLLNVEKRFWMSKSDLAPRPI